MAILLLPLMLAGCARLDTLNTVLLDEAQAQWRGSGPDFYRLAIEMEGDRVSAARFDVLVRSGEVVSLRRNGISVSAASEQDYSMAGLFTILRQELALIDTPSLLGAPAGYSAYAMARFDEGTGRLIHYRRTVGGTNNTIDIRVVEFEEEP